METKETINFARILSEIISLEKQKMGVFMELGAMYYDLYKQYGGKGINENIDVILKRIENIELQISERKADLNIKEGTICCPNCNSEISADSRFCSVCGSKLKICRCCGKALEDGQLFCMNCGTKVEGPIRLLCAGCGAELEEDQKFCTICGRPVDGLQK